MQPLVSKTYYDIQKLTIWGDGDPDSTNSKPRLGFGFRDGMPRLTVYTGIMGPEGIIPFPADYPTMYSLCEMLEEISNSEVGECSYSIDSLTNKWENNKPTREKMLTSTIYVGKSKEGLVYLSVISENKPKLVFTIKPSDFHTFKDKDKTEVPVTKMSSILTRGIVRMIRGSLQDTLTAYTNEEYEHGARKPTPLKQQPAGAVPASKQASIDDFDSDIGF